MILVDCAYPPRQVLQKNIWSRSVIQEPIKKHFVLIRSYLIYYISLATTHNHTWSSSLGNLIRKLDVNKYRLLMKTLITSIKYIYQSQVMLRKKRINKAHGYDSNIIDWICFCSFSSSRFSSLAIFSLYYNRISMYVVILLTVIYTMSTRTYSFSTYTRTSTES